MNTNRLVLLIPNVRDPGKNQMRYDRRETAMKGETVTFSNLHSLEPSSNDIHNCHSGSILRPESAHQLSAPLHYIVLSLGLGSGRKNGLTAGLYNNRAFL
jgi:hypothetical protein